GGFNSSNTTHLQEIAIERQLPSYHIDSVNRIISADEIEHKPLHQEVEVARNWLPSGSIVVGVTSGASTPDRVVEDVINKIFELKITAVAV
ncbi:MAG: 4-hydroxy-3-methylbut-2-enyl diphosphate reductase, partial [Moorea sp. SIO3I6]|nr:4-hydroxy-3-methylbut-2-enyl diphosphate reductase [Moorena sp. SIO3I6]